MQTEEIFHEEQKKYIWSNVFSGARRIFRGLAYFLISFLLARIGSYEVPSTIYLAMAIGLLGAGSSSARLGQLAIAIMLLTAVLPLHLLTEIRAAIS